MRNTIGNSIFGVPLNIEKNIELLSNNPVLNEEFASVAAHNTYLLGTRLVRGKKEKEKEKEKEKKEKKKDQRHHRHRQIGSVHVSSPSYFHFIGLTAESHPGF